MPANDILLQSIIDRLDRIEDKIDSHIAQGNNCQSKSAFEMVKANGPWVMAVIMGLGMVFGGASTPPTVPSREQWQAVASSTLVAAKRLDSLSK